MSKTLHLVLKFPVDYTIAGGTTDTITEHKQLCWVKNRLIWGRGSGRLASGVAVKNRNRLKKQISNELNTYSFFLGKRHNALVGDLTKELLYPVKEIENATKNQI